MRIAHVVPSYLPATRYGGPIYSVHGLCRALVASGHDVHVFTTSVDGPGDSDVPHNVPVVIDGVKVHYFQSRHLRRLYYAPSMRSALDDHIRGADVVHLHSVFLWPTNMAARLCQRHHKPYVLSPRGMLVPELIRKKNRWIKTAWLRLIESTTVHHAARVHCTSERERAEALQVYPRLPGPPCIVPNGVDAPLEVPDRAHSRALENAVRDAPYCLFLGRIHWVKGIDRFLRAAADTPLRIILCGPDDEGYAATVSRLVDDLGMRERVTLLDAVSGTDKWWLLGGARFLVLPSVSENFGNVIPEAMAMGCPVVTMDTVGAAEIVTRAGAGFVCHGEASLRASMMRLWSDHALRRSTGCAARAYVDEYLRGPRVAAQIAQHYADIIAQSAAAHP